MDQIIVRLGRFGIGDDVHQRVGIGVGEGHVQRLVPGADLDGVGHLVGHFFHVLGDLLHQGLALVLVFQFLGRLHDLGDVTLAVEGHPYHAGVLG